jgi:hypothetical protein
MRVRQVRLLCFGFGFAIVLAATGCGDAGGPGQVDACSAGTELTVSPGLTPVFSWSPDCVALTLYVMTSEGPQGPGSNNIVWAIQVPPDNGGEVANRIRSGVVYGQTPQTAAELVTAVPLKSGVAYTVFLEVSLGGASAQVVASHVFTPG